MYVKANTDNMRKENSNVKNATNDYGKALIDARQVVNDIGTIWKDSAYDSFKSKMEDFLDDLSNLQDSMASFSEYVDGLTNAYDKLEEEYNSKTLNIN